MKLKLFNTLWREKQEFKPIDEKQVGIYTCGPTVYGKPHIWNLRAYIFASTLRNVIENILWIQVKHVVNITDVGHLTDDGDQWEDKLEKASKNEKKTAWDIAKEYENIFYDYLQKLNIKFDIHPKATEHIQEQIDLIKKLEEKGYTYIIENDGVYMDTSKVKDYGKLLPKGHLDWILACARVQNDKKKNKTDFALWKFSPKDEKRQMEWDSPWGVGFPGWHIECSAMSCKYLWERFDIHTWWIDHVPVHHTDEIAQSETAFWHKWVNYWLHNEFLNLKNWKMSKSLGNVVVLDDIIQKWFNSLVFKYFIYTAHYRSIQDFSWKDLKASEKAYKKLRNKLSSLVSNIKDLKLEGVQNIYKNKLSGWEMVDYLLDDIDTVKLIAYINKFVNNLKEKLSNEDIQVLSLIKYIDDKILKLDLFKEIEQKKVEIPEDIKQHAEKRWQAKQEKKWEVSDKLRDELLEKWYKILDKKDGYEIEKYK